MLFNSIQFLVFFAAFLPVYFLTPSSRRWLPIVVGSYLFYMAWNVSLSALLLALTLTAYGSAIAIERSAAPRLRKGILIASICAELVPLLIFKYTNFVISMANDVSGSLGSTRPLAYLSLILPVGISFHTFQIIGYLVDVHSGRVAPERHLGRFAGFVVFFPQLVAGPIERSYHMLPQFWRPTQIEYVRVRDGLLQAGWGLSKKACVADLVAPFVAGVYADPRHYNGSYLLIATLLFAIQIYCDFSGYTDMALGIAKILGYDLMVNFRQPYFSTSLAEFWRRWHISLSTWFRDYVYIPLGGNRCSTS
jgi:alginate O-acetyltransferase complex protein AlgI